MPDDIRGGALRWAEGGGPSSPELRQPDYRYRPLSEMARGGMSRVYLAQDRFTGHEVALKVLARELSGDAVRVQRFQLEAKRVAALQHRNIVPLLDYGVQGDWLYLVMPVYPATLRDVLARGEALSYHTTVQVAAQIAAALDYAHKNGIIHRDVKPENVLLDAEGHAYLTDFGIAKSTPAAPQTLATSGPLMAAEAGRSPIVSIEYTPPEILLGRPVDPRADVYGLAVVVYEMLTGRVPFPFEDNRLYALVTRLLAGGAPPPSAVAPVPMPRGADAAILRALNPNPERRFPTADIFASTLAALDTEPGAAGGLDVPRDVPPWITEVATQPAPPPFRRPTYP